jgi:hypothetical protein
MVRARPTRIVRNNLNPGVRSPLDPITTSFSWQICQAIVSQLAVMVMSDL